MKIRILIPIAITCFFMYLIYHFLFKPRIHQHLIGSHYMRTIVLKGPTILHLKEDHLHLVTDSLIKLRKFEAQQVIDRTKEVEEMINE